MATIHIARGGANLGTFSVEGVGEGLRTGRFLPTDLAWEAGMPEWRPLSQVIAGKEAVAPPATSAPEASVLPVTPSAAPGATASVPASGLPWEHRQELGFVKAFFDTVIVLLTKPAEAFAMMKPEGDLIDPLLFALIGGSAGMIVAFLFQAGLYSVGFMADRHSAIFGMGRIFVGIILIPVMLVCGSFVWSGLVHLCLMLAGGARKPFETTFRVVCFSTGSTHLLAMVPFCGRLVAPIYNIVLQCMGLARAHETDTGKAVIAVLLPIIVCCGGLMLVAILGGFSALSLFSRH